MYKDVIELVSDRKVLLVGNDAGILNDIQLSSEKDFQLAQAATVTEGLEIIATSSVQLLIIDQQLGEDTYLPFLTAIKTLYPAIIRILITEEKDPQKLIASFNKVQVDRFIALPSDQDEVKRMLGEAFEQYDELIIKHQSASDLFASNASNEEKVGAIQQELNIAYDALRDALEDNQKNINFIEAVYNSVPGLLYLFDHNGELIRWNKKFNTMLGYTDDELLNVPIMDLFRNDDESKASIALAMKEIESEGYTEVEARMARKNGTYIPMHFTASPVHIGGLPYFTGIGVDLSQQNESNRQLTTLISNLPGFAYRCANDKDWTMYYISDVCEKITGYPPEDLILNHQLSYYDLIHPDFQAQLYQTLEHISSDNKVFEYEYQIITATGELRWMWEHGAGVYDVHDNLTHLEGLVLDITPRKNAQKALKESEEKFRTLFREMNELAVFCTTEVSKDGSTEHYKIINCNDAFLHAFNLELKDVIDKSPLDIIGMDNATFRDSLIDAVSHKRNYSFTTDFSNSDKMFQVTVVPVYQQSFAIIASDITTLTQFNKVLMEKNNELENYVYVTSHDLRSPLVNIQGFSSRLKKQTDIISKIVESCDLEPAQRAIVQESIEKKIPTTLDFIFNNVNKMEEMLNGLLQLSRTGRVTMDIRQIPMRNLIVKVIQAADHQLHEISSEIVIGSMPDCYGDENMLNQLFSNLISNAIKYRNPDHKLKISIDGIMRHRKVQFRVQDNGIGIAQMHLEKIWQVFFRVDSRQHPGDGVGLSVVKRIVEKHKGKIWVESREEVGSTFFIELPAKEFSE